MLVFALLACVVDRTGQSASEQMRREVADHGRRVRELETVSEDMARRVGQLEEVTRARGQEEILKMETMEQLRQEVARLRGDFEVLQHDYGTFSAAGTGFQDSTAYELGYIESRVILMEKALGLKAPPPPPRDPAAAAGTTGTTGTPAASATATVAPTAALPEAEGPKTPEEFFTLIEKSLADGNGGVARAVAKRFIDANPKSDRVAEAYYRIAESWQNEASYRDAAAAFMQVVDRYPKSSWASWSTLRIGECFTALGDKTNARLFYEDVVAKYPKSKAAKEAKTHLGK